MATTYELIASSVVGSGGASSILFDAIPGTFDDLLLVHSLRTTRAAVVETMWGEINGSTSSFTLRSIEPNGSTISNDSGAVCRLGNAAGDTATASTFASSEIYIPNYAGSASKSFSITAVQETNGTTAYMLISAMSWAQSAAITSIKIVSGFGNTIKEHSSAYLYGITRADDNSPGTFGIQATGGDVTISGGYKYHVFKSSGTFNVTAPGWAEVLVIGGGGGAAYGKTGTYFGVPGGAGQVQFISSLLQSSTYLVAVGAGGAGAGSSLDINGSNGTNSSIGVLVSNGGGGGLFNTGVGGSSGNGFLGGNPSPGTAHTGGGGGATANGANATASAGGAGGAGTSAYSLWGAATSTGQDVSGTRWYGGGGGGSLNAAGGNGGGGASKAAGSANTGGGAGGGEYAAYPALSGGSGIVIIRYPVS